MTRSHKFKIFRHVTSRDDMIERARDFAVYGFLQKATILLILVTTAIIEMEITFFICHVTWWVHMFNALCDLDLWMKYLLFI